jgi:methylenetetrahydrofolate dehydrogenase (NADP+)/methenyltetrahydrofolate cyclohydrolase
MIRFSSKTTLSAGSLLSSKRGGIPSSFSSTLERRLTHSVSLQLDYYMSPQFAGVACAMTNQLYEKAGIDLKFLPICPVGLELERVRDNANKSVSSVTVGSVEQNIFVPTLYNNPALNVKAVAAMFRKSPLCLASLGSLEDKEAIMVGAHEDTVSLLERILVKEASGGENKVSVVASPRATKNSDLIAGKLDLIQAYTTTEVPTLERQAGLNTVFAQQLEGLNGAKLGYSQVMFAPEEDLQEGDKREVVQAFLDATFSGWSMAIRDYESAAKSVEEAKLMLALDDESNDHWDPSFSYTMQSVGLCSDYVKETFQGNKYGVIDAGRWNEATKWLLAEESSDGAEDNFGLDPDVWQPSPKLLAGNELARNIIHKASESAKKFEGTHARKPSLAVVTVGELSRYTQGQRRLEIYSNDKNSWYNKTGVGEAHGFQVNEIQLPGATTTDELLSEIYALKDFDGIQLMWPLPPQIDSAKVYGAIDVARDVDGAHYIGQLELNPEHSPMPPVTPAAVIDLMENYDIDPQNKRILVVGRSRIVGSPLAHMLRDRGAIVTVAHSEVSPEMLESLVRSADIVVSCAGAPGLLKTDWVKEGAEVINVGVTYNEETDANVSDFDGELEKVAKRFSPVPGGIGPLSVAALFRNVATAAWARSAENGEADSTWTREAA